MLVGISEQKKSLGRPGNRWGDNIKVNLKDLKLWTGVGSGYKPVSGLRKKYLTLRFHERRREQMD